jgi:hypothetical protein
MIRSLMSAVALAAAVIVLAGCTDPTSPRTNAGPTAAPTPTPSPSVSAHAALPHRPPNARGPYRVKRVIAANLIDVVIGGRVVRVAVVGLGVPGCRAGRASARARGTLGRARVYLTGDPAVRTPDAHGLRHAYVWVAGGGLYALTIIRAGYGRAARQHPPLRYARALSAAEHRAHRLAAGIWHPGACATSTPRPTPRHTPRHTVHHTAKPHVTRAPRPHRVHTQPPALGGPSAVCRDHTFSFSHHRRGTCSHHHGVLTWLRPLPA